MNKHKNFLKFNGKNIIFLNVDGTYWIAIRPICEALKIDPIRSIKNLKKDPILGPEWSNQATQVSKNGKSQLRNMTCIPEKFIYGWIFSLRSDSEELNKYKRTCYEILFNHFRGTITNRKELLQEKDELQNEIHEAEQELLKNPKYQLVIEHKKKIKKLNRTLTKSDKELLKQPELFGKGLNNHQMVLK